MDWLLNNEISNQKSFSDFREANTAGYFLFGEQLSYDCSFANQDNPHVTVWAKGNQLEAHVNCLERLSLSGIHFGRTCDYGEVLHRNRLAFHSDEVSSEAWVGRDLKLNIPGLYWMTFISTEIESRYALKSERIRESAKIARESAGGVLYTFFDQPEDWKAHIDKMDLLCATLDGVFSISQIQAQLKEDYTFSNYRKLTSG